MEVEKKVSSGVLGNAELKNLHQEVHLQDKCKIYALTFEAVRVGWFCYEYEI